jgi:hypothetical protein
VPTKAAAPKDIVQKMADVMGELGGHKPSGTNSHFRYDYWETNQVSSIFRDLFVKHGLAFLADVEDVDIREKGKMTLTTMRVRFTIMDTESTARVSGIGVGQGEDNSDKGANKAFSGALKYWLLKTFLLGGEDAENDAMETTSATDVVVVPSNVQGIQRGGRSTSATVTQVDQVRMLARALGYGPVEMNGLFEQVLENPLDLEDDITKAGAAVRAYLDSAPADDLGRLIQYMKMMTDTDLDDEPSA